MNKEKAQRETNIYESCEFPPMLREIVISNLNYHVEVRSSYQKDNLDFLEKKALSLLKNIKEE
jgi:hypothetical protein